MFSDLAKCDLEDLRAEGLKPTDEDIIRLNTLALQISNGVETTAFNLPRFAIAGGVMFWEMTFAALEWYHTMRQIAPDEETKDRLLAFASANGRKRGFFAPLYDPKAATDAVNKFYADLPATWEEVVRAVGYATLGNDHAVAEETPIAKRRGETDAEKERKHLIDLQQKLSKAAAVTGFTFDDLMLQTPSRLCGYIYAAHCQAGEKLKEDHAAAHAAYLATLKVIAERLRKEKNDEENN